MARGWESKAVEAQIESSTTPQNRPSQKRLAPEQAESIRKKDGLLLARARVLQELQSCGHPRRREMLNHALADLAAQLAKFE